jgi:tryptophan-rich sensory protein
MKLIACLIIGFLPSISAAFSKPDSWYRGLRKSAYTPPDYVFPIVWPILYAMIGLSLYFYLTRSAKNPAWPAIAVFAIHLALNSSWSLFFFRYHLPRVAFLDIILMLLTLAWIVVAFYNHSRWSAFLLIPYALWLTFAAFLDFEVVRLN